MSQRKLTVARCGNAHLVLSVRAQTGQAAARLLGVGAEAVARLEARPARHRAPTPGGPRRPLAVDWRLRRSVKNRMKGDTVAAFAYTRFYASLF